LGDATGRRSVGKLSDERGSVRRLPAERDVSNDPGNVVRAERFARFDRRRFERADLLADADLERADERRNGESSAFPAATERFALSEGTFRDRRRFDVLAFRFRRVRVF
jgi:hypothetical protein